MNTQERPPSGATRMDGQRLSFGAMPDDEQESAVRRLVMCGFAEDEVAARTGWTVARIGQVMREQSPPAYRGAGPVVNVYWPTS